MFTHIAIFKVTMQTVLLETSDKVELVGDYYEGSGDRGALLLHMMPVTRESWREFAQKLIEKKLHVLAIDLRGHGGSSGGPDGYKNFSDKEHQASIHDVEAGVRFLKEKGIRVDKLVIIGASIGANLALWYMADNPGVKQVVLLSPGLNYKGIETKPFIRQLKDDQHVFFASSEDDVRSGGNNVDMNRTLHSLVPEGVDKKLMVYKTAGHGTDMFGREEPDLETEILGWIR